MRKNKNTERFYMKNRWFPLLLFFLCLGILLLMSGFHTNVVVLLNSVSSPAWIQIILPVMYWCVVAAAITLFIRKRIRDIYEVPTRRLAEGMKKVAEGDFSIYVPTVHTAANLDYIDKMILDFNKMVEELGSVETLKTDFVSNVSHEMKTPISIIKNYAELIQLDNVSESDMKEFAGNIEEAAVRLSSLVSNILKLNKLENQRIAPEMEYYNLCGQLEECILQYEEIWDRKDLTLEVHMDEKAVVLSDRSLMDLVWNNLFSNAAKFTEPGGQITINQKTMDGCVEVTVSDTGCGMSEESIRHIYDKFYQGDTSHTKEGNGLGLALAKRVLELMNGEIRVFSIVGKGSTFTVRLPAGEPFANGGENQP